MTEAFYLCAVDGYDPDNSARWCGCGCGSDYNRMVPVDMPEALKAADERIRELGRWLTTANGESYRARQRIAELETTGAALLDAISYDDENPCGYLASETERIKFKSALKGEK